jgi:hypothetical protein
MVARHSDPSRPIVENVDQNVGVVRSACSTPMFGVVRVKKINLGLHLRHPCELHVQRLLNGDDRCIESSQVGRTSF